MQIVVRDPFGNIIWQGGGAKVEMSVYEMAPPDHKLVFTQIDYRNGVALETGKTGQ